MTFHQRLKDTIKNPVLHKSKIGQNALIKSKVFEQSKYIMGETNEDMDIEI